MLSAEWQEKGAIISLVKYFKKVRCMMPFTEIFIIDTKTFHVTFEHILKECLFHNQLNRSNTSISVCRTLIKCLHFEGHTIATN